MADDVFALFAGETEEKARRGDARRVAMIVVGRVKDPVAGGAVLWRVEVKWVDRGYGQEEPLRFASYFARFH